MKLNMSSSVCQGLQGWSSFLFQSAPDLTTGREGDREEYIHPLAAKGRSSMMSEKSLEMCTESLGSETGSDVGDELSLCSISLGTLGNKKLPLPENLITKKLNKLGGSFPPPLTTSGFHMRPCREGGRVVLEAVAVAPWQSVFLVERRDGRIRVGVKIDAEEEEEDKIEEDTEVEESGNGEGEDIEGNSEVVGGEMGSEKFQRPRRCKERGRSNERLLNWEPFLVAI